MINIFVKVGMCKGFGNKLVEFFLLYRSCGVESEYILLFNFIEVYMIVSGKRFEKNIVDNGKVEVVVERLLVEGGMERNFFFL